MVDNKAYGCISTVLALKVTGDTETCEGRGPRYVVGYYLDYEVAYRAASGKGVMGGPGYIEEVTVNVVSYKNNGVDVMRVLGEEVHTEYEDPQDVRERALSKLSDKEKKALGLM